MINFSRFYHSAKDNDLHFQLIAKSFLGQSDKSSLFMFENFSLGLENLITETLIIEWQHYGWFTKYLWSITGVVE